MPKKLPLADVVAEIFNKRSAARFLNMSESAISMRVHRRQVPYHKSGGRVYFLKTELLAFMQANAVVSVEEARERASG